MYHDTIKIEFKSSFGSTINFDLFFLISKNEKKDFTPINYKELLNKFKDIGFNIHYIKFNDIDEKSTIFCNYNFQPNFENFFKYFNKTLSKNNFYLSFSYCVFIDGKYIMTNMNSYASISFSPIRNFTLGDDYYETIIEGKKHVLSNVTYQICNSSGEIIDKEEFKNVETNNNFFQKQHVKVYLRKYKLKRLSI